MSVLVNDVHSGLNDTAVHEIVAVDSVEAVRAALERARASGRPARLLTPYPELPVFLDAKLEHDPGEPLQTDWYRWLRDAIALEEAA